MHIHFPNRACFIGFSGTTGLVGLCWPPSFCFASSICWRLWAMDIDETKRLLWLPKGSQLIEWIMSIQWKKETKWCLDCLGWRGFLGSLGRPLLERPEGPSSETSALAGLAADWLTGCSIGCSRSEGLVWLCRPPSFVFPSNICLRLWTMDIDETKRLLWLPNITPAL